MGVYPCAFLFEWVRLQFKKNYRKIKETTSNKGLMMRLNQRIFFCFSILCLGTIHSVAAGWFWGSSNAPATSSDSAAPDEAEGGRPVAAASAAANSTASDSGAETSDDMVFVEGSDVRQVSLQRERDAFAARVKVLRASTKQLKRTQQAQQHMLENLLRVIDEASSPLKPNTVTEHEGAEASQDIGDRVGRAVNMVGLLGREFSQKCTQLAKAANALDEVTQLSEQLRTELRELHAENDSLQSQPEALKKELEVVCEALERDREKFREELTSLQEAHVLEVHALTEKLVAAQSNAGHHTHAAAAANASARSHATSSKSAAKQHKGRRH